MSLVQLALSIATGGSWLGAIDVATPGRVLLMLAEEDTEEVRRRIYYCARGMELSDSDAQLALDRIVPLGLSGEDVSLVTADMDSRTVAPTATHAALMREAAAHDYSAILLDPLARLAPSCESDTAIATRTIEALEALARLPSRPTVLVAHHTPKWSRREGGGAEQGASAARGVTALTDGVRWVATLTGSTDDDLAIAVVKNNGAPGSEPIQLARGEYGVLRAASRGPIDLGPSIDAKRLADATTLCIALRRSGGVIGQDALRALAPGGTTRQRAAVGLAIARAWIQGGGRVTPYTTTDTAPTMPADSRSGDREEWGA
jgi:hypothetical protein